MNAPSRVDLESPGPGLPAFLLARLDEREALARAAHPITSSSALRWTTKPYERRIPGAGLKPARVWGIVVEPRETLIADTFEITSAVAEFIAANDPRAVLDDVAAKRQLVKFAEDLWATEPSNHPVARINRQATYILRLLALPYTWHPDYREEWKP